MIVRKCGSCGREIRVSVNAQGTEVLHEAPQCPEFLERMSEIMGRAPDVSRLVKRK